LDPFVSNAANFEDVMLWRALKGVMPGFYIDVGAHAPVSGSVSGPSTSAAGRGSRSNRIRSCSQRHCGLSGA
jgi:hypothetical protein